MAETQEPQAESEIEIDDLDGVAGGTNSPLTLDGIGHASTDGGHGTLQVDHGRK